MSPAVSAFDATLRLGEAVLNGEVIFFVGSGFSIDSEGNTTDRLVGRLLAGVLAMDTVLAAEAQRALGERRRDVSGTASEASQERPTFTGLRQVFGLAGTQWREGAPLEPARCMTEANIKLLVREYYNFNEWAITALGLLSAELLATYRDRRKDVSEDVQRLGSFLLRLVGDNVPLDDIQYALDAFTDDDAARGKALFLDIMGFANPSVMGGDPSDPSIEAVAHSYDDRLRPRHHALARLAREGLARLIVTTNYDLLLEGAYRLAGFLDREAAKQPDEVPSAAVPMFSTIAGADQFFGHGEGQRTALVLKIHGSVHTYRQSRAARLKTIGPPEQVKRPDLWAAYLPAMVFTYREIQTWRADAWSRDLIRTLLRTHTLALCGYSGADPILHATFREVYEERADATRLARAAGSNTRPDAPENAPLYFFGLAARREFHSLEILRAATIAAGYSSPRLVDHPNLIESDPKGFPTIDDHFRVIVHGTTRHFQLQGLTTRLRRLAPRLLQQDCPDSDYEAIVRRFKALCRGERAALCAAANPRAELSHAFRRQEYERLVNWTWHFAPGLLREFALAEVVENRRGAGRSVGTRRNFRWYQAASERLEWSAWAAVLELALRSMVHAYRSMSDTRPFERKSVLTAEASPHAAVSFARARTEWQPHAICIRLRGFDRPGRGPDLTGAFRRVTYWEFTERDLPWPLETTSACPTARFLWNCAVGQTIDLASAAKHLGVSDDDRPENDHTHPSA
jgi:SIR2-like protein